MTNHRLIALLVSASFAACSAPQGKRLAANPGLVPIAAGPPLKIANVTWQNRGEVVSLARGGTVTALLESNPKDGYSWKLSEIPDPTVLKLVSKEYVPPASPGEHEKEKWVFQSTGAGDVDVKLWYGNPRPSEPLYTPTYDFIASVEDKPVKSSKRQ
jgi:predicted secreted protein